MTRVQAVAKLCGLLAAAGLSLPTWAAPEEAPGEAVPASLAAPVAEPAREAVRSTTLWLARGVDGWFGDKPFSAGGKVTDGRLSVFGLFRQGEKADLTVRFNARFWLPNLEDRAYVFLGRDDVREAVIDKPGAFSRQQGLRRDGDALPAFFAGLGYRLREALQFRLGFRGGLKPYAHARYAQDWRPDDRNLIDFRETLFWTLDDRFGSTTALSYEYAQSPSMTLRWLNSATITQKVKKFEWNSSLGAYQSYGDQRLLSVELVFSGLEGSGVPFTDVGVQAKWEQPIYQDWLLVDALIGHFWPRPDAARPRGRAWALGLGLQMKF